VTIASPSIRQERAGRAATAAAACGKRREKSLPFLVSSRTRSPSRPRHDAEAVMLDLVNPVRPGRRLIGAAGQAWLDETG
jgi:hypothetical protein